MRPNQRPRGPGQLLRLGTVLHSHSSGLLIHRSGYTHVCLGLKVEIELERSRLVCEYTGILPICLVTTQFCSRVSLLNHTVTASTVILCDQKSCRTWWFGTERVENRFGLNLERLVHWCSLLPLRCLYI
jgi:hypothetical protein